MGASVYSHRRASLRTHAPGQGSRLFFIGNRFIPYGLFQFQFNLLSKSRLRKKLLSIKCQTQRVAATHRADYTQQAVSCKRTATSATVTTQQDLAAECVVVSGALLHSAGCYQPRGIQLRVRKGLQLGIPTSPLERIIRCGRN